MKIFILLIFAFLSYILLIESTTKNFFYQCDGKMKYKSGKFENAAGSISFEKLSPFIFYNNHKRKLYFSASSLDRGFNAQSSALLSDLNNPVNYFTPVYKPIEKSETFIVLQSGVVSYVNGNISFFGKCDFRGDISKFSK